MYASAASEGGLFRTGCLREMVWRSRGRPLIAEKIAHAIFAGALTIFAGALHNGGGRWQTL